MATVTLTCARCGAELPQGARFCLSCGAPVAETTREERRVVTIVFGDLSGFTELSEARDAELVKGIVDRAFARANEIVARYGGHVDKVIGDEIMAVFGAPVAHEDDAERAVRAALAIQREIAEQAKEVERAHGISLRMHIGINTGEVVAGHVAGSDNYTVLGDAVNTARRIGDVAEAGQTLAGQPTVEVSKGAIEYRRVGQVTAKGKRLPVVVWEAVAETGLPGARTLRAAPLIGREEELSLLESLARIVKRDRRPLVATLIGEAGMGKSRLAAEFARRASAHGVRVLNGRSLPYGTASPAFALEEMVRQALLLEPGAGVDHVRSRLDELGIASEDDQLLAFLGLAGSAPPAAQPPGTSSRTSTISPLVEAAITVLRRTAEREGMLVCAFHELHWAEDEVLDAVLRLARSARAPVLALCLSRPELLEKRPDWSSALGSTVLPLEPLPRARATEMLDVLAPSLPPAVRENVLDRAGGNPFYLEELARLYVDEQPEDFAVPGTVQALVSARLDALPPREKRLLQDAAVIGEQFWPGALERLHGIEPADAKEALTTLIMHGFVEPSEQAVLPGEEGYRFRQTLVREVAYNSVPKNARATQHEVVGRWLEEVSCACGKEREFYDLIAYHFERAAVLAREIGGSAPEAEEKAREYLRRAGDGALGRDATVAASGFFERALALTEDGDDLELRLQLADTLVGMNRHHRAQDHLARTLEDARAAGDRPAEARTLRLLGDSRRMSGDMEGARESVEQALTIARETHGSPEEAAAMRAQGLIHLQTGRSAAAIDSLIQALARYRELGDARGEGWCLQNLGWASMLTGRHDDALRYLDDGEEVFRALDDEEGVGWCVAMRGWVLMLRGDIVAAGEIAEKLEHHLTVHHPEYAQTAGFALELQRILRAFVSVARGRFAEAERIASAAVEQGNWSDASWAQALARFPLFQAALFSRRLGAARAAAEEGWEAANRAGDPFYRSLFSFGRAWLALEECRFADAERLVNEQIEAGETGALWGRSAGARWVLASALRAQGKTKEAMAILAERTGSANLSLSPSWARALYAELLADAGDLDAARTEAARASEEAGEIVIARVVALEAAARIALVAGDPAAAETLTADALALLDETDWAAARVRVLAARVRALDALRRHDEAAEALDRARAELKTFPPDADTAALEAALQG